MTAEERQILDQNMENLDQNMEDLKKRFQNNPWLSGLVKRAASDSCSYGCAVMMHNVCQKCMTAEERQILDQNMENLDQNMEDLEKRFQNNPWLSSLVKRSASDSCSAESAGCAPGTEPASINNVCKCLTPEQLKNALNSAMDGVVQKFPWMSGLVKRSASSSECRAG